MVTEVVYDTPSYVNLLGDASTGSPYQEIF